MEAPGETCTQGHLLLAMHRVTTWWQEGPDGGQSLATSWTGDQWALRSPGTGPRELEAVPVLLRPGPPRSSTAPRLDPLCFLHPPATPGSSASAPSSRPGGDRLSLGQEAGEAGLTWLPGGEESALSGES